MRGTSRNVRFGSLADILQCKMACPLYPQKRTWRQVRIARASAPDRLLRLHGFSTTIERHAQNAQALGVGYRSLRLPVVTLASLCEAQGVGEIDFLKIDVEGAEPDVLAGGDFKRFRPKVIVAEAVAPGSGEPAWQDWEPQLLSQGYRFALFDTLNRFYVAEEHPAIMARLPRERADWHAVRHMYEIGRAPDNAEHPDHALARDLARGFWANLPWLRARAHRRAAGTRATHRGWKRGRGAGRNRRQRSLPLGSRPHRLWL
jgi:hypothetical protein